MEKVRHQINLTAKVKKERRKGRGVQNRTSGLESSKKKKGKREKTTTKDGKRE